MSMNSHYCMLQLNPPLEGSPACAMSFFRPVHTEPDYVFAILTSLLQGLSQSSRTDVVAKKSYNTERDGGTKLYRG